MVESYLVDGDARVVVRSSIWGTRVAPGVLHRARKLKPFPYADVALAMRQRRSGLLEVGEASARRIVAFVRLASLGWYYVEETDPTLILGSGE